MSSLIGQSLGRYHILEQLGEGGMATVYKAFDTQLERNVAVKVLRTDQFAPAVMSRTLKRFDREAKALGRLTHPNIVQIIDYGDYEGKPYLVMPFVPGQTLKHRLIGEPIPYKEAIRLLLPIARGLEYAHQQGVIHRDIKPSNVLITESGEPMLSDFGVAKIVDEETTMDLTGTSASVGTPEYMAPEQAMSKTVDSRADIYSLGIVFYEMVTGRKPYVADTPLAVLIKHASEPLPRPKLLVPTLPDRVEQIILKALAKKPEDRYQTMGEFVAALERCLAEAIAHEMRVKSAQAAAKPPGGGVAPARIEKAQLQKVTPPIAARPPEGTTSPDISKRHPETEGTGTSDSPIRNNIRKPFLRRNWGWIAGVAIVMLICLSLGGGSLGAAILGGLFTTPTIVQANTPTNTQISIKPTNSPTLRSQIPTLIFSPTVEPLGIVDPRRKVISVDNGKDLVKLTTWNTLRDVASVAFSPDGTMLAVGYDLPTSGEPCVSLINTSSGSILYTLYGQIRSVNLMQFSHDGTLLASGGDGATINLWRVSDGSLLHTLAPGVKIDSIDFSPDGKLLALGLENGTVQTWRVSDGVPLLNLPPAIINRVSSISFSPDGTMLAASYEPFPSQYPVVIWNVPSYYQIKGLTGSDNKVSSGSNLSFSPDGTKLAAIISGSAYGMHIWRISDWTLLTTIPAFGVFSPDWSIIASTSYGSLDLWRVSDGALLKSIWECDWRISRDFSPDGRLLASGCKDTVSIWGLQ